MSEHQPIFRSPVSVSPCAGRGLYVRDLTGVPVMRVQGEATAVLEALLGQAPGEPGDVVDVGQDAGTGVLLARLRPDRFYLFGLAREAALPSPEALLARCAQMGLSIQAVDATHAVAALVLTGAEAPVVLSKICGLDFYSSVFPDRQVRQSSAAKIKTLIARRDEQGMPTYHLHVSRPFGQYFLDTLWDAGQEFGIGEWG